MAKIKGWERNYELENMDFKEILYGSTKSGMYVSVINVGKDWEVWIFDEFERLEGGGIRLGTFMNKDKALNLAREYMRSHPNG